MKILNILFTLLGVITVIFFLFQVLPGDPGRMMMGQNEDDEQLKAINARYGFDKPVFVQYLYYLNDFKGEVRRAQTSLPIRFQILQSLQLLQYFLQQFLD